MWSDARKKSHVGILAKEKADAAAKSALSLSVTDEASFHRPVSSYNKADTWSGRKLHAIRPTVGDYKQKTCLSPSDTVLLNRLHIGHTRLTNSYLLSGDDISECGTCQCPLTVKHILI